MTVIESKPWEKIRELLHHAPVPELEAYMAELHAAELVRCLFRLTEDEQRQLLLQISPDAAAEIIEDLPDSQAAELLDEMSAVDAASIFEGMQSDDQADILAEMDEDDAAAILEEMDEESAADARRLLEYDPDTAGGVMQTEFISYPRKLTVRQVLEDLAEREEEYANYGAHFIYVVQSKAKLLGVLRLRDIMFCDQQTALADIVKKADTVAPENTIDQLAEFFDDHEINVVPVVNERGYLLGVVRRHALEEALSERADGERLRQAGIVGGEEFRSMPIILRSRRRLSWLSVNIVLNLLAASVIAMYQDTLTAVIALAVFLPIVSDMSGCSGNQAVAVSLREISLGVVVPRDFLRVWRQEAVVGLINGLVLGGLIAIAAIAWNGNPWLGAVVGAALAINTVLAVSIGGTVPLLLRALGIDPAIAAGPILTTVTDMCGFALVLGFATVALPLLT